MSTTRRSFLFGAGSIITAKRYQHAATDTSYWLRERSVL
jgi:hypothetical protein